MKYNQYVGELAISPLPTREGEYDICENLYENIEQIK